MLDDGLRDPAPRRARRRGRNFTCEVVGQEIAQRLCLGALDGHLGRRRRLLVHHHPYRDILALRDLLQWVRRMVAAIPCFQFTLEGRQGVFQSRLHAEVARRADDIVQREELEAVRAESC